MRFQEIQGGLQLPVDFEERELLTASTQRQLFHRELDERSQEVARKMVTRGLFNRHQHNGKLYYVANSLSELWRF